MKIHRQYIVTNQMLDAFYLSPYAEILKAADGLWVGRREKGNSLFISGDPDRLERFFERLAGGMDGETLMRLLGEMPENGDGEQEQPSPEEWKEIFVWEGIIE